jgi:hypothetical protein
MTTGIIVQINVSRGGVPKRPVAKADVVIQGLVGDSWDHPNIHGGTKQAVLSITAEGIDELSALGFPLFPGRGIRLSSTEKVRLKADPTSVTQTPRSCQSAGALLPAAFASSATSAVRPPWKGAIVCTSNLSRWMLS